MMITLSVSAYGIGKYTGESVVQQLAVSHTGVTERGVVAGKTWEYYSTFRYMWWYDWCQSAAFVCNSGRITTVISHLLVAWIYFCD